MQSNDRLAVTPLPLAALPNKLSKLSSSVFAWRIIPSFETCILHVCSVSFIFGCLLRFAILFSISQQIFETHSLRLVCYLIYSKISFFSFFLLFCLFTVTSLECFSESILSYYTARVFNKFFSFWAQLLLFLFSPWFLLTAGKMKQLHCGKQLMACDWTHTDWIILIW